VAKLPIAHRQIATLLHHELDALLPLRTTAEQQLEAAAKPHDGIALLATAPGMGPIRSAQVAAAVVTPERFEAGGGAVPVKVTVAVAVAVAVIYASPVSSSKLA